MDLDTGFLQHLLVVGRSKGDPERQLMGDIGGKGNRGRMTRNEEQGQRTEVDVAVPAVLAGERCSL